MELSCKGRQAGDEKGYRGIFSCEVINSYPHDVEAFTQGLAVEGDLLYESTGLHGRSSVRKVDLKTGRVFASRPLSDSFFGEGLEVVGDRIFQITWRSRTGFVYDKKSLVSLRSFTYPGEGWGLTYDGKNLIMSDGTSVLRFLNRDNFREERRLEVRDEKGPVFFLNELEYVEGEIFANIWNEDRIAIISPRTGMVSGWIDLEGLRGQAGVTAPEAVPNGIAYDEKKRRLFVTGKYWPRLFEIRIAEVK